MITLLALAAAVSAPATLQVPTDRYVAACGDVELRATRKAMEVACRVKDGVVELETDHGDIAGLRVRAKRWPVAVRFVLESWRFENVAVSVVASDGERSRVDATRGRCAHPIVSCLGRTDEQIGERRISKDIVVPETRTIVTVEIDGRALAPGESLDVGWIDAYRR